MTEPLKTVGNVSISSFQSFDGSNFTVAGIEEKYKYGKGYASAFVGAATNFKDDGMFVVDLKGGYDYDSKGIFNQNLRIRNKMGKNTESTQIRYSPLSVNVPVGKKTNIYINPHYSGQYDYNKDKWTNSIGAFAGVTQKINDNASISIEGQRYNLQDIKDNSGKNWSVNAIVSYKF